MQLAEDIHNKIKSNYEEVYKQKQHEESVRLLSLRQEEERRLEDERRIQEENNARHAAEEEARRKQVCMCYRHAGAQLVTGRCSHPGMRCTPCDMQ